VNLGDDAPVVFVANVAASDNDLVFYVSAHRVFLLFLTVTRQLACVPGDGVPAPVPPRLARPRFRTGLRHRHLAGAAHGQRHGVVAAAGGGADDLRRSGSGDPRPDVSATLPRRHIG
jgi:hypothetical protein